MTRSSLLEKYGAGRLWTRYGVTVQVVDARESTWDSSYLLWTPVNGTGGRWVAERNFARFYREVPNPDLWEAFTEGDQFRELDRAEKSLYYPLFADDPTIDAHCSYCGLIRLDASGQCPSCGCDLYT